MESEAAHEVPRHVRRLTKAEETTEQYSSLIGKVFIESKRAFTVMKVGWIEQGKEHEGELVAWYCDVAETQSGASSVSPPRAPASTTSAACSRFPPPR